MVLYISVTNSLVLGFAASAGSSLLVALARCGDLLLCAKDLFVAASVGGGGAALAAWADVIAGEG